MKDKLTPTEGCYFNDRITIKISPCDLERYCQIIKAKAEQSCKYSDQAMYHEVYDKMWKNFTDYQEARKEKDAIKARNTRAEPKQQEYKKYEFLQIYQV